VKIKDGVVLTGTKPEIMAVLHPACLIWRNHGQELVITAGTDGVHMEGSLHYKGLALDFRTRYFGLDQSFEVASELRKELGDDYDVILHSSHCHVEYDPKETT